MKELVRIDDEVITEEDFILHLKLNHQFSPLLESMIKDKVTIHAAKKRKLEATVEEMQKTADDFRLTLGLHRAQDTFAWLELLGVSVDQFENFINEQLLKSQMIKVVTPKAAVEEYFKLNSPKFDTVDIYRIVTDSEDKAKEVVALLEESPDSADEIVEEFSSEDQSQGECKKMNAVGRDQLEDEISAKVFSANVGDVLGPFQMKGQALYEVILVVDNHPAELSEAVRDQIVKTIYNDWLQKRFEEHSVTLA